MNYPNSVRRSGGAVGLSTQPKPVPRPQPIGPLPRRKPGRPKPHRPRRAPAPAQRPASPRPVRVPALPVIQRPQLPRFPRGGMYGAAFGLGWALGEWLFGDPPFIGRPAQPETWTETTGRFGLWSMDKDGYTVPAGWVFMGLTVASGAPPNSGWWPIAPQQYDIGNQAGYHPNVFPDSNGNYVIPLSTSGTGRMILKIYAPGGNAALERGWFERSYRRLPDMPNQPGQLVVQMARPAMAIPMPVELPWWVGDYPMFAPVAPLAPMSPVAPPLIRPHVRPWSPEAPDVGPRPEGSPYSPYWPGPAVQPSPWPGASPGITPRPDPKPDIEPVPPEVPAELPEIQWEPVVVPHETIVVRNDVSHRHQPRQRPRRAPRGTKETKVRASRWFRFVWNSFNPVTEGIDMVNFMYECLPWKTKVREFQQRGRQPNPAEKLAIMYRDINSLNVGCALTSYIKEQLEDRLYALGSGKIAKANRKDNRPIGYEAGGGLTGGGGPMVDTGTAGAAPEWLPEFLPW